MIASHSDSSLTKAMALFIVVLLLTTSTATLFMNESDAPVSYQQSVTYHRNLSSSDNEAVQITYDGIASAEYNPEFGIGPVDVTTGVQKTWLNTEGGSGVGNVTLQVTFDFTSDLLSRNQTINVIVPGGYTVNSVSVDGTIQTNSVSVSGNTITATSNGNYSFVYYHHRGTVEINVNIPFTYESRLFGGWSESQSGSVDYYPGDVIPNGVTDLYAVWVVPTIVGSASDFSSEETSYTINGLTLSESPIPYSQRGQYPTTVYDSGVFGRIYTLNGDITVSGTLPSGTYRNANGSSSTITVSGNVTMEGDVIIDDLELIAGGASDSNHGDGSGGLFANGNMLIIGPDVTAPSGRQANTYLQVYGGHWSNPVGSSGNPADTDVRIFAGTYYNVVAGSRGATVFGDTHLVMRGGVVLDTVIGGNSGNTAYDSSASSQNRITGSTYVYMLGDVRMPGDYYEEFYLQYGEYPTQEDFNPDTGRTPPIFLDLPILNESTILTGGSNNGYIGGGTNVYISNDAMLWDVQAGGRRGNSTVVGTASAEVSGNAVVKHVLCGSITDGMDGSSSSPTYNKACVGSSDITVMDGASVGSVFGAGYDTYYQAIYSSMVGTSTTISITLEGDCVVGYVYGGGYRGTIGTTSDPIGSITINLDGGTVLWDVFGGGRGGLDKSIHDQYGVISDTRVPNSIWDSTGYSEVYAETITINVNGGKVNGDIYGGGESVPVIGSYNGFPVNDMLSVQRDDDVAAVHVNSVSVNVADGGVGGSVYGAGKGVDPQDTVTLDDTTYHRSSFIFAMGPGEDGSLTLIPVPWASGQGGTTFRSDADYDDYASTIGNVNVDVSGSGTSIGGSVYGGGEIGRLGPTSGNGGSVTVSIGSGADVAGDVFGGGYGQTGELSSNTLSRTVIVNGATIGGSVYGGSRLGNDNYDGSSTFGHGQAYIYVVSGDIESGASGNVYGGSYRGYSYMDTHVYIGAPAVDGGGQPVSDSLKVHSVYGGASVGESSGFENDAELLIGNSEVIIGDKAEGSSSSIYSEFSITGDVFGEGDYCAISGSSEVTFRGFSQESQLLSVQKADALLLDGSALSILGNVDGSQPQASERLSLNLIGNLAMMIDDVWGASSLDLHSAASQIGGFSSYSADGGFTAPNFSVPGYRINSITLHNGMLMSILGVDNAGVLENPIQGYTLIDNGSSTYYGTFVMGATASVQNGSTGFFVQRNGAPVATQEAHYDYGNVGMTMWYLSGVYKLESTVVLEDGSGTQKDIDVMAPKTVRGSSIQFVGGYINAASPGSLNVVGNLTGANPGEDFLVTVGRYIDGNHLYYYDGEGDPQSGDGGIAAMPDDPVGMQGSGILLNIQVGTNPGFSTTGYAGTIVLHMVERIGDVPINTFDVEVSIYLRTTDSTGRITNAIVMSSDDEYEGSGYRYTGSTDVYLPVLSGNHMAEYLITLSGAIQGGGSLTMQTVPTNLNKEGWQTSMFSTPGVVDGNTQSVSLGVGGVFAPVIRFGYTFISETEMESFDDITLTVNLIPEDGWEGSSDISYTIVLSPEKAQEMVLSFFDTYLQTDPIGWSGYSDPVFSLNLEFGTNMAEVFVAVNNSFIDNGLAGASSALDYINGIRTSIGSDNSVLYSTDEGIVHGSSTYVSNTVASDGYTVMTIESFLGYYVQHKPDTIYDQNRSFDYNAHPAWYDTDACMTRFNFESEITNDLDVFAGYSVTIYIIPFTDPNDPNAADKDYTVTPTVILLDQPGIDVDLASIYSTLSITPGYTAVSDESNSIWWSYSDGELQSLENLDNEGRPLGTYIFSLMADSRVYLYLERATYTIEVIVDDDDTDEDPGTPLTLGSGKGHFTMTVNGDSATTPSAQFDDQVSIEFQWDDSYHIERVIGVTANGSVGGFIPTSSGGNNTIEFSMPNGDLSIRIIMTDQNTVTVNLPSDGTSDNGRFGLSISQGEGSVVVGIVENSNIKSVSLRTQSDSMSFSGDITLGTRALLISAYSDGTALELLSEPGTVLNLSSLGDNITIDLYISVKWDITISGDGYSVSRYALLDPLTGERSSTADAETYSDANQCDYVLNGDRLLASSESPDVILTSLTTNGLTRSSDASDGLGYVVNGTIDVLMSLPMFNVTLSIVLTFDIGGQTDVLGEWTPTGTLTVNGDEVSLSISGQTMVWSGPVTSGDYEIVAEFDGFTVKTVEETVGGTNVVVPITLSAIQYAVHWTFPVNGDVDSGTWYVNDSRQIDEFTGNTDAVLWFRSTASTYEDSVAMGPDDILDTSMFGADATIHLLGVPSLNGEGDDQPSGELEGTILILVEGDINGPHQMVPVEGVNSPVSLSAIVGGMAVTATYTPGESTATVTVAGCPDGTGGLVLYGESLNIILVSVPGLDAI